MARARRRPQSLADLLLQFFVEVRSFAQDNEQHDAGVETVALAHHDGFLDIRKSVHHAVDLRCADADTSGVQCCIRATVDDEAASVATRDEVAVRPDSWKTLEVRRAKTRSVVVPPKTDRPRGERRRAYQLTADPDRNIGSGIVDRPNVQAEGRSLNLSTTHWFGGYSQNETSAKIGAPGNRGEVHGRTHVLVDVVEQFRGQG